MNTHRLARAGAVLILSLLFTACGGGGGDDPPPPPPDTTPPTLTLATTSPAPVNAPITFNADEPLADGPRVEANAFPRGTQGTSAILEGTATLSADRRAVTWTHRSGALPYDSVVVLRVTVQDLAGNASTTTASVTTQREPAPPGWPPAVIAAQGVRVVAANQLPAGCDTWRAACWQQAVAGGTVKFVATGRSGPDGRTMVFAYFRNATGTGLWNVMPFYLDNGSPLAGDINGGLATEVDFVVGSAEGVIYHQVGQATCTELVYTGSPIGTPRGVACP